MTKRPSVDWVEVEGAMRRGKTGLSRPGDSQICERAFRRAPREYGKRKKAIDETVVREEQERWR